MKFSGVVKKHLGRGKKLGFPTANLDAEVRVPEGIYAAFVLLENGKFPALFFTGKAETFGGKEDLTEVYLLDFNGDLYGQEVEVEVLKKFRDNQKFDSTEELISQMKEDEQQARNFFANLKK